MSENHRGDFLTHTVYIYMFELITAGEERCVRVFGVDSADEAARLRRGG